MVTVSNKQMFPCPICACAREVRITKKNKPYITCDPCGVQLFVRGPAGIDAFNRLVDRPGAPGLWAGLQEMEDRYYLKCQKCGSRFWIEPNLIKANIFDGSFQGFRCPQKSCAATVPWDNKQ
jgi:transcription elongation factor Elf1